MKNDEQAPAPPAPQHDHHPVLLAALGDDESDATVAAMALQAARLWPNAELHLVHVIDTLPVAQAAVASSDSGWAYPGLDALRRQGADYVARFVRSTGEALGRPVTGHLLFGPPVAEIVKLTTRLRASMLVVGTRDVGRLARLLAGSTADALVHKVPCSLMIARAPKRPAEGPRDEICPDCLQAEANSCGATLRCARHALAYGSTHGPTGSVERKAS